MVSSSVLFAVDTPSTGCLQSLSDLIRPALEYGRTVAVAPNGEVYFKDTFYPQFVAQEYAAGKTTRFFSRRYLNEEGEFDPSEADAIVLLLHGNGADYSHSGSMLSQLEVLSEVGWETEHKLAKKLQGVPGAARLAAMAIDLPGHGLGPRARDYWGEEAALDGWLDPIIEDLRRYGKPVIIFARSGSCGLARAYAERHPGKVNFVSAMSPVLPHMGYEKSVRSFYAMVGEGLFIPNLEGFTWIESLHRSFDGTLWDPIRGAQPSIYFVGGKDRETPLDVQQLLVRYGETPGTRTLVLPKAYHDVFSGNSPSNALKAYTAFYGYLGERVPVRQQRSLVTSGSAPTR